MNRELSRNAENNLLEANNADQEKYELISNLELLTAESVKKDVHLSHKNDIIVRFPNKHLLLTFFKETTRSRKCRDERCT
jgi:hypothetical protein